MLIRTYADIEKLAAKERLSRAERTLLNNCKNGVPTVLGTGGIPKQSSAARRIRAGLLRYLILGGCEDCLVHEMGVFLVGGWIDGALDLSFAAAKGSIRLIRCHFAGPFVADQANLKRLVLSHSAIRGLSAPGAVVQGNVFLDNVRSNGLIDFVGAEIGGQLSANDGEFNGADLLALNAQGAAIRGGVFLDRLKSTGTVSLTGADIGGQLVVGNGELNGGVGDALNAQGASIRGGVFLEGLKSTGTVSLSGAEVSGQLSVEDGELNGGGGDSLNAQGATITGGLFLDRVKGTGTITLAAAKIGNQFNAIDASMNGGDSEALNMQGASINGDVCIQRLTSLGTVVLAAAEIGGQLAATDARLNGGREISLRAHGLTVKGLVSLDRLKSTGAVELIGAKIGGQLDMTGAELDGGEGYAFSLQGATIGDALFWDDIRSVIGRVDLNSMYVGTLADEEDSWKSVSRLNLIGLIYDRLAYPNDLAFRKRWLKKGSLFQDTFYPQPYQQLARFYRESGHRHEAREILIAKEREQRKAVRASIRRGRGGQESTLEPNIQIFVYKLWDEMMRVVAGYGYKPWLSLWWLGGLVAAMTLWSHFVWQAGDFAPNSAVVLTSADWKVFSDGTPESPPSDDPAIGWSSGPGRDYETFYSFAYAMDVVVPVLELGQMEAWAPSPARGVWGYWLFYGQKIFVVLGWVVTALAAAAVTGMIRRDD